MAKTIDMKKPDTHKNIAVFEEKAVRRVWHMEAWYFSISDVVQILSSSKNVKEYIKKMRSRDKELSVKWGTICTPLPMVSKDGKKREEISTDLEGIFRIIQSISSPKAEPFKRWLARVGKERVDEIQDPELAVARAKEIYDKKGYPADWVAKRMGGINVRHSLTDEWKDRGVKQGFEFAILTDEIYKRTFGVSASDYKKIKSLSKENNLGDHMDDIELILTMLGEATTTKITIENDSKDFKTLKSDANSGGRVAGNIRKDIENRTRKNVVSEKNFFKDEKHLKIKGKEGI